MFPDPHPDTSSPISDVWPDIAAALDRLSDLSRSVAPPSSFCAQLASALQSAAAAQSVSVWVLPHSPIVAGRPLVQNAENPVRWRRYGAPQGDLQQADVDNSRPPQWLATAAEQTEITMQVESVDAPLTDSGVMNRIAAAAPVRLDDQPVAVLHVECREQDNPTLRRALVRILDAFAEVAEDYFAQHDRRRLLDAQQQWANTEAFVDLAHRQRDWKPTAYVLANESRGLLGCDRVSLLRRRGRSYHTECVSGLDVIDRRSNTIRALELLAAQAGKLDQLLWYGLEPSPEELQPMFEAYIDASNAKVIAVLPLVSDGRPESLLICEFLQAPPEPGFVRDRLGLIARHADTAVRNALRLEQMPLLLFSKVLESIGWRWTWNRMVRGALVLTAIIGLLITAFALQTDLEVKARGELQPAMQRRIFAPADGSIVSLGVQRGDQVSQGQTLLKMADHQLDFDEARISGNLQTNLAELQTVRTSRLKGSQNATDVEADNDLAAREKQLEQQQTNLNEQLAILRRKRQTLEIRSPIAGQILTGDLQRELTRRPVKRGQRLMVVADTAGEWLLRLRVSDELMKHVLDAKAAQSKPLRVRFMLASHPGVMYEGRVTAVADQAESHAHAKPHVLVTVEFDRDQIEELHAGADVAARIVCRRSSIGYAWMHRIYERIRIQFFI